ncbi:MAG TPA: MerR family transcriptional regulator [Geobacteraceae bacterium]|nr:MerR family transcriptional regulator [Geobacteraceae bacterium]
MEVEVPDKLYFRIGEVAELASLKPSILRFWETEFDQLNPVKSSSGQRLYSRKNVELILQIKSLLYSERLTIEGARKKISERKSNKSEILDIDLKTRVLREVKEDLIRIRDSL